MKKIILIFCIIAAGIGIVLTLSSKVLESNISEIISKPDDVSSKESSMATKILPEPDIKSPVKIAEKRGYKLNNHKVDYDNFVFSRSIVYNKSGYELEFYDESLNRDGSKTIIRSRYSYDFDDNNYSYKYWYDGGEEQYDTKYVYNNRGQLIKTYDKNNKIIRECKYNETGQIVLNDNYDVEWKETYSYNGDTKTTQRFDRTDGKYILDRERVEVFDDEGNLMKYRQYSYSTGEKRLVETETFYLGGKKSEYIRYQDSEIVEKALREYNSHGELINCTVTHFYYDDEDGNYTDTFSYTYRREYDKYGNPTIEYFGDEILFIWNYTYHDGTEFLACDHYPEYFKNNSSHTNTSMGSYPQFNSSNSYNNSYDNGNNNQNYTPQRYQCRACRGSGRCSPCGGTGRVLLRNDPNGNPVYGDHRLCNGSGDCSACKGDGWLDPGIDY